MRKLDSRKILQLQEAALTDEICRAFLEEHAAANSRFLETLVQLSSIGQDAVLDYLGVLFSIHQRLLYLALTRE